LRKRSIGPIGKNSTVTAYKYLVDGPADEVEVIQTSNTGIV